MHNNTQDNSDLYKTVIQTYTDNYIGKMIGGCKIVEKIGEGGIALVYKARHQQLDMDRVMKILRPGLFNYEDHKERFLREAKLVARITHNNIVHVHNVGEENNIVFIEMEYLQGETLRESLLYVKKHITK